MKGLKKCYGVLSLLAIIFGFSLNVCSDTSAVLYNIDTIPLSYPIISTVNPNMWSHPLSVQIQTSVLPYNSNLLPSQYVYTLSSSNDQCQGVAYKRLPALESNANGDRTYLYYGFSGYDFIPPFSYNECQLSGVVSNLNRDSVLNLASPTDFALRNELSSLFPFRYKYNGFFRRDSRSIDGFVYDTKIDLLYSLFTNMHEIQYGENSGDFSALYPDAIYKLRLPLGPTDSDTSSSLHPNQQIKFSGKFLIDLDDYTSSFSLTPTIELHTSYVSGSSQSFDTSSCSVHLQHVDLDDPTSLYSLSYTCPYTLRSLPPSPNSIGYFDPSYTFPFFYLEVSFDYGTSNTKFASLLFESSISVTDNDYTLADDDWNSPITGSDPNSAPGSAVQFDDYFNDDNVDFFESLKNLFNFNFSNPFAPIFSMFDPGSNCAQIPTLAGMLHSEETEVCSFFSDNTRAVLTPVFTIASMMIIFGFTVRWLGSRSGNFIEDSGGIDSGGYHFENKFRRKK